MSKPGEICRNCGKDWLKHHAWMLYCFIDGKFSEDKSFEPKRRASQESK